MILLTGGAGYLGQHVLRLLLAQNEAVTVIDDLSNAQSTPLPPAVTLHKLDVSDKGSLSTALKGKKYDTIIHLAALISAHASLSQGERYHKVNTEGTANLLSLSPGLGVKHFIFASSAAVYGNPGGVDNISESTPPTPTNPYGTSKLLAEEAVKKSSRIGDFNYAILRFFNLGGATPELGLTQPATSAAIIPSLVRATKDHTPLTLYGSDYSTADGTVERDFVHVLDAASSIITARSYLINKHSSLTVNIGSGSSTSLLTLIKQFEAVTGKPVTLNRAAAVTGDIVRSVADITLAKNMLGYTPKYTLTDIIRSSWQAANV